MRASPSRRAATSPTPAPATDVGPFPSSSQLPRTVSWKAAVPIAFGGALSVTVSFGAMAGELGNVSMWVWIVTAAVGALQCLLVSDLATRFPGRAGGTAQFAFRAWPRGSATLGALSSWSYWFAWIPAVPVMLILAASYLKATFWPGINTLALAIAMALLLYALNLAGLRRSTQANIVLAIVATVPLIMVLAGPVARPSHFHASNIFPLDLPQGAPNDALGVAALMVKWAFIAACSSYGAELASTLCAEIRDSKRHLPKIMAISALTCLAAYTLIPLALLGIVGAEGLTKEPTTVFLPRPKSSSAQRARTSSPSCSPPASSSSPSPRSSAHRGPCTRSPRTATCPGPSLTSAAAACPPAHWPATRSSSPFCSASSAPACWTRSPPPSSATSSSSSCSPWPT